MIKYIELQNFRSHKYTKLEFCKGVNVIIGDTDAGKSNIIRAFDWVFNNAPSGEEMRSDWGGDTKATVAFDNGKVTRIRTNNRNEYRINDEKPFKSFGVAVPEAVKELINMTPTNFEHQFERPFIIGWKPGERGEFINEICDFKIIDRSISNINSIIRNERVEVKRIEQAIVDKKEQLVEFENLDEMEIDIANLEFAEQKLSTLTSQQFAIQEILADIREITAYQRELQDFLKKETYVIRLDESSGKITLLQKDKKQLEYLLRDIIDTQEDILYDEKIIAENEVELKKITPKECPLCGSRIK